MKSLERCHTFVLLFYAEALVFLKILMSFGLDAKLSTVLWSLYNCGAGILLAQHYRAKSFIVATWIA
jgi:hypothetical protein